METMTNNEAIMNIEAMASNVMVFRSYYQTDKDVYAEVDDAAQEAENALRKLAEKMRYYDTDARDVMSPYSAHNPELVRAINDAWKNEKYHNSFKDILYALLMRDYNEYEDKYCNIPKDADIDYAIDHAREIMEGVCDDEDLKIILSFVGYTRK